MAAEARSRPAWASIDLDVIAANAAAMARLVAPAELCAVVKANGYGHGAADVSRAALAGGATRLAVALVEEGVALRKANIEAPILVLSQPSAAAMADVVLHDLVPTLYTRRGIDALAQAAERRTATVPVHVKADTGMHRVGADPAEAVDLAETVQRTARLTLEGFWTHLAVSEDLGRTGVTEAQLDRFDAAIGELAARGVTPRVLHAANSAGAIAHPRSRYDLVRCGIALYGYAPGPDVVGRVPLKPAMTLAARVTHVRQLAAGEGISYGLRYVTARPTVIATVPLGYADGVPRALAAAHAHVLVDGRRCPIAGTITMDQLMIDCGPESDVSPGDEVVLIGSQRGETITAEDWADRLGTISYEIVCGVGPRVPRRSTTLSP
ncbi:MAG TPA: alanine racemase [Acidimicrobiales bacterium]|nr:alanine racemase [Acidimicrobiales bacterium]